ncbi:MAG: hypothetical protein Q9184_002859, partial [Pyrenodesmia sp. 2 TL-2023]
INNMPPKPKRSAHNQPATPPPGPGIRRSKRLREQALPAGEETDVPAAKKAKGDAPATVRKGKKQPKKAKTAPTKESEAVKPKAPATKPTTVDKPGAAATEPEAKGAEADTLTSKPSKPKTKPTPINTGKGKGAAAGLLLSQPPLLPSPYPSPYALPPIPLSIPLSIPQTDTSTALATAFTIHSALPRPLTTAWKAGHALATWYRHAPIPDAADAYTLQNKIATIPVVQAAWIGAYGQIVWEDAVSTARAMKGPGKANVPQMRGAVEVKRRREGEDVAFELVWRKIGGGMVKVNGTELGGDEEGVTTVGALPDFAIIEIEDVVIFWFGKAEALDFVPNAKPGVSDEEISGEIEEPAMGEGEKSPSPNSLFDDDEAGKAALEVVNVLAEEAGTVAEQATMAQTAATKRKHSAAWGQIFHQNMQQHLSTKLKPGQRKPHQIKGTAMLDDENVVLGIATVWQALRERGRHFAFNESANYQYARKVDLDTNGEPMNTQIPPPVYRQRDLIIPLIIDRDMISPPNSAKPNPANEPIVTPPPPPSAPEKKNGSGKDGEKKKEKDKGHTVLAVAKRRGDGAIDTIIMDSCLGYILPNRIRRSLRKTVCQNGWERMDLETGFALPLDEEPSFTEKWLVVPHQEGIDTCGIYTILNAWVYMLGLTPIGSTARARYGEPTLWPGLDFPEAARRIINLALRGHMDLLTVQAFLNTYGYCELQDPEGQDVRLPAARTIFMTSNELNEVIEPQRDIELTQEKDRAAVIGETKCTYDVACLYLDIAGGNVGQAVENYRAMNRSSEAPGDEPTGDEVIQGIGSFWCALDAKANRRFAFHDYSSSQLVRRPMMDVKRGHRLEMPAAANGPRDLLIPMHFTMDPEDMSPPNSTKEEILRTPEHTTPEPQIKPWAKEEKKTQESEGQAKEKKPQGHIIFALAQLRPGNKASV